MYEERKSLEIKRPRLCHISHPSSSLSARVEVEKTNEQFASGKPYNEPIDRDDLRFKPSSRNEMATRYDTL